MSMRLTHMDHGLFADDAEIILKWVLSMSKERGRGKKTGGN
jgi:hypothetical protein